MTGAPNKWAAHLDALCAAPEHHRLLLENEFVRVLETRVEPGETVRLHTHRWSAAYYILAAGEFVRRDENGDVRVDSRQMTPGNQPGEAVWSSPLGPHTLENVGRTPIHVVSVEVKASAKC